MGAPSKDFRDYLYEPPPERRRGARLKARDACVAGASSIAAVTLFNVVGSMLAWALIAVWVGLVFAFERRRTGVWGLFCAIAERLRRTPG